MIVSRRVRALVLTVLMTVGTFGISNLDAWLYHGRGADPGTTGPHYEPAGTTCGHADRCVLGVTIPGPRVLAPINVVGRLARLSRVAEPRQRPSRPRGTAPPPLPHPRAPPTLPA